MKRFVWMALVLGALLSTGGCRSSAEQRLLILHEAKIVLRHSTTEQEFAQERALLEQHLQEEDPDGQQQ